MFRRVNVWLKSFIAHPIRLLLILAFLLGAGLIGVPHLYAWYHFRAGRSALESYQTNKARDHLDSCLKVWDSSAETHFLASRAARRAGDYEDADRHLGESQRLNGGPSEAIALEWALLRASAGDLGSVEQSLYDRVNASPHNAGLIWEALTEGYMRMYRILDALASVNRWLQLEPDNLRTLVLRGHTHWQVNALLKAIPDYRKAIERDPEQDEVRERLALGLLETSQYSEALTQLEELARRKPDRLEIQVRLALCQYLMGKRPQARRILQAVFEKEPEFGPALRTRGQINQMDGQLEEAEQDLRRAARLMPFDHTSHYKLHQVLEQLKKPAEAKEMALKAEHIKKELEKLQNLSTQQMSVRPNDPALHCEMGKLLLSMGHTEMGHRWLLSALKQKEDFRPAHAELAKYYLSRGETEKAAEHRERAREN